MGTGDQFELHDVGPEQRTAFVEALLLAIPYGQVSRDATGLRAQNWGVEVIQMTWTSEQVSGRVDRLDATVLETVCRQVDPGVTVTHDLKESPLERARRRARKLLARIPHGRWGR